MDKITEILEVNNVTGNVGECINERLNEDCILHIFRYLKIVDLLKIESVCKKWQRLSQQSWPHIEKFDKEDLPRWGLHSMKKMTLKDEILEKMLRRFGKHLKYLNLGGFYGLGIRLLSSIVQTCSNLRGLNLSDILEISCNYCRDNNESRCPRCIQTRLQAGTMLNSWTTFNQLSILSLQTDFHQSEISNLFLNMNKKLETLEIVYKQFYYFPISLPKNLPFDTLKQIILISNNDERDDLKPLIPVLKQIHVLHTAVFYNMINVDIIPEVLIPNANTLKALCIDFGHVGDYISTDHLKFMGLLNLVNLERLLLQYVEYVNDEFLEQLVKKCKKLVYVNLSNCDNVTDTGISHLFKLPALKYLLKDDVSLRDPVEKFPFLEIDYYFPMLIPPLLL